MALYDELATDKKGNISSSNNNSTTSTSHKITHGNIDPKLGSDIGVYQSDTPLLFSTSIDKKRKAGLKELLLANSLIDRAEIKWYTQFNRFGCLDCFNNLELTREYLFFVKPDLHIMKPGIGYNGITVNNMNEELKDNDFFVELVERYPDVVDQLQMNLRSGKERIPFMTVLSNSVKNTLDLPSITANEMDSATNSLGTTITYRGSGLTSDNQAEFTLEFEDTRFTEIYMLFRAYEEYERLKRIGKVSPPPNGSNSSSGVVFTNYHKRKALHDQFGIYKFIVDDDLKSIIFYSYICGVYPKSVPRDAFSDLKDGNGLKFSVDFKGQFVYDSRPSTLVQFNRLIKSCKTGSSLLPIYDTDRHQIDGRWATNPYVIRKYRPSDSSLWIEPSSMNYRYELVWQI